MKVVLTLSVLALSALPALAGPGCKGDHMKGETASSCAPGTTWDPATATCSANPTS